MRTWLDALGAEKRFDLSPSKQHNPPGISGNGAFFDPAGRKSYTGSRLTGLWLPATRVMRTMNEFEATQRTTVATSLAKTPTDIRVLAFEETGEEPADKIAFGL